MAANDKVMFKVGLQSSIDTMITSKTGYNVGTFYLTSDSDRLYVGQASGLQLLNKSVKVVANEAGLSKSAHKDDFAYITDVNVLAVYDGDKWVQINPDTNTIITAVTKLVKAATNGATISTTVSTKTGDNDANITGTDITITGAAGAKVEQNGTTGVKVTGDTYTLSSTAPASNSVDVKLTSALGQAESSVKVKAGDNVQITGTAGNITVSATDTKLSDVNIACATDDSGKVTVQVKDTAATSKSSTVALGYNIDGTFYGINHKDDLPVYTKDQVDEKFTDLNPMRYIGTIGASGDYTISPTTYKVLQNGAAFDVSSGDMFLVAGDATYAAGSTAKTGDLLIASGTEVNGVLAAITWNYVPSGDDTTIDTHYLFKADTKTNTLRILSKAGSTEASVGQIQVIQGTAINVSSDTNGSTANQLNVTINHANVDCDKPDATSASLSKDARSFTTVKNIEVNEQGHVTKIETEEVTTSIYKPGPDVVSDETTGVKVSHSLYENGQSVTDTTSFFSVASDTLKVKKDTNSATKFTVELLWGSF